MPTPPDSHRLRVEFGPSKREKIREIGRARQQAKTTEHKAASRDGHDIHVMGFAAEAALAEAIGVPPDMRISPDGHGEVSLRASGVTFDTCWRSSSTRDLAYWPGEVPKVHALVLACGDLPEIWLQGWISHKQFLGEFREAEFGRKGKRWVLPPTGLRPIAELYTDGPFDLPKGVLAQQPEGHPLRPKTESLFH